MKDVKDLLDLNLNYKCHPTSEMQISCKVLKNKAKSLKSLKSLRKRKLNGRKRMKWSFLISAVFLTQAEPCF